jgi:hypothetical protein
MIMKKIFAVLLLTLLAAIPASSRAQLMKKLLANAQNTITGHNSAGEKKDTTQARLDSVAAAQRMAQLMNSSVQHTGPSISSADSAAAIRSFKTAAGGDGQYYEFYETYTFSTKKVKDSVFRDTISMCLSDAHYYRNNFSLMGARTVMLGRASMPLYSIHLQPEAKTYSLHLIDTALINRGDGWTYQVTRVGTERVSGFDCIHARLTMTRSGGKQSINEDIWTSTGVPGYEAMKSLTTVHNVTPQFMKALDQAGCGGFTVKMVVSGAAYSMTMVLAQATRKSFSASDFEIPPGYTAERNNGNAFGGLFKQ